MHVEETCANSDGHYEKIIYLVFPTLLQHYQISSLCYTLGNFTSLVLHEYPSIFDGAIANMLRNKHISYSNVFASICHHLTLWRPPGDYYHFFVTFFVHFLRRGDPNILISFDMHDSCHPSVTASEFFIGALELVHVFWAQVKRYLQRETSSPDAFLSQMNPGL